MYGMVWYGIVWHGMVWYGMVWYGMVLYVYICMYACMHRAIVRVGGLADGWTLVSHVV